MADPIWVDGTTPLNSANMTKLQTRDERAAPSGYAPLDAGSKVPVANLPAFTAGMIPDLSATYQVVSQKGQPNGYVGLDVGGSINLTGQVALTEALASSVAFAAKVSADANNRWVAAADGKLNWGPGNAVADTNLYRSAASVLKTDGQLYAGSAIISYQGTASQIALASAASIPWMAFGVAQDTLLYRPAAGSLKTDTSFDAAMVNVRGAPVTTTHLGGGMQTIGIDGNQYWMNQQGIWVGFSMDAADFGPGKTYTQIRIMGYTHTNTNPSSDWTIQFTLQRPFLDPSGLWSFGPFHFGSGVLNAGFDSGWVTSGALPYSGVGYVSFLYQCNAAGGIPTAPLCGVGLWAR